MLFYFHPRPRRLYIYYIEQPVQHKLFNGGTHVLLKEIYTRLLAFIYTYVHPRISGVLFFRYFYGRQSPHEIYVYARATQGLRITRRRPF